MFDAVEEFNRLVVKVPEREIGPLSPGEAEWLLNALNEEQGELQDAHNEGDVVGQVDALIDTIYFAMGGLTRLGLTHEQSKKCFDLVHSKNMTKAGGVKAEREVKAELDAYKPEGWEAPEEGIKEILGMK